MKGNILLSERNSIDQQLIVVIWIKILCFQWCIWFLLGFIQSHDSPLPAALCFAQEILHLSNVSKLLTVPSPCFDQHPKGHFLRLVVSPEVLFLHLELECFKELVLGVVGELEDDWEAASETDIALMKFDQLLFRSFGGVPPTYLEHL